MESGLIVLNTDIDSEVSQSFSTQGASLWNFYVTNESGGSANHKVILQIRPDNSVDKYFKIGEITGIGVFSIPDKYAGSEVRLKVVTPEGAASISHCYIFGL